MKKQLLSTLLLGALTLGIATPAFANYKYKLYDPTTKQVYSAQMITFGRGENYYGIGLAVQGLACAVENNTNKNKQGLVGGNCYGFTERNAGHKYAWREFRANTYYNEVDSIIQERKQEGMYLKSFNMSE